MKKIYGGLDVTHNVTANGKRTVQSINGDQDFDSTGNLNIDSYTDDELNQLVEILPLSKYGDYSYLPAGVNGSFDGASENTKFRWTKIQLENDGTLVYLRGGTNGSSEGVYYSSIKNALNIASINGTNTNTIAVYKPGYFSSTQYARGLIASDQSLVAGYVYDLPSGNPPGTNSGIFISYTNGTLNATQHSGFIVPIAQLSDDNSTPYFFFKLRDNNIYCLSILATGNIFQIYVYKITVNQSTMAYTVTRVTGWNNTTFYHTSSTGDDNLIINRNIISTNIADKPYQLIPVSAVAGSPYMTSFDIFAAQDPTNTSNDVVRLRVVGDSYTATSLYSTRFNHNYSFTINLTTKTCVLDAGNDISGSQIAPIAITNTGTALTATGSTINSDPIYNHTNRFNVFSTYFYMDNGNTFCMSVPNLAEALILQRCNFTSSVNIFQNLEVRQKTSSNFISGKMRSTYGSSIGSSICGLEIVSPLSTRQDSRNNNGDLTNSYAVHGSSLTYPFKSLDYGSLLGYEPTTERQFISTDTTNRSITSYVSGSTCVATGGPLILNVRHSVPLNYDQFMNSSGTISIDDTVFQNFSTAEFAKVNQTTYPLSPNASKNCYLYVPQQTDMPAFAMLTAITTTGRCYFRVVEVTVPTRSGNITSVVFNRVAYETASPNTNYTTNGISYVSNSSTGLSIYDLGTHYAVGGSDPLTHIVVGNSANLQYRGLVQKSTKQFTDMQLMGTGTAYTNDGQFIALPGKGFGTMNQIDGFNKIVFNLYGTTVADYNAWTPASGDPQVLVSQDVAEGFIVYFTENTQVLLSGRTFTLPVQSIDLKTVTPNPANMTFYVYVTLIQGLAQYLITTDVISESGSSAYNVLWIGTVSTNSNQISSISINKRDRLDVFGASYTAAGASFPISFGTPSTTGTINW